MKLRSARRPVIVGTAALAVFALGFGGNAAADAFITGDDVKNGSLSGADIKTNSITWADIANGTIRGTEIANGTIQLRDMSEDAMVELFTYIGEFMEYLEIFSDLQALKDADAETATAIADIKSAAATLADRVTDAEGDIGGLVEDFAELQQAVSDLETASGVTNENVNALRLRIKAVEESLEVLVPAVAALDSRIDALEAADAVTAGNWGTQLRNVMGSATAALREGPVSSAFGPLVAPPAGTGSLQIDVANGSSKVAFGNEVDFAGDAPSTLGSPSYKVFTTKENVTAGGNSINVPTLNIELNPDVTGSNGYTSLVFTPTKAATQGTWTTYNTATDGYWWFTNGATATATQCGQANSCTLVQALAGLGNGASLYTVAINKGRDFEFHGAVDALQVGGTTYDFEARGVIASS